MKIVQVMQFEIFSELNYGGVIEAHRHYQMFIDLLGEDNVYTIIVTSRKGAATDNRRYYIYNKHTSAAVVWNCLHLRVEMSRTTEKEIVRIIRSLSPDIIFFESTFWGGVIKKVSSVCRTIVFMHNIEKNYAWNRVIHKSILTFPRFLACWYNESVMLKYVQQVICLTERDEQTLGRIYRRNADAILPVSFRDKFCENKLQDCCPSDPFRLFFIGSNFPPNLHGISWFVHEVMPKVNAELYIVGKGMEKNKGDLEQENVHVIGTVENTERYYYQADAVVLPIFFGDGMKLKTAEAFMYGKTVIGSKEAFEGYEIEGVDGICCCCTADEYIQSIEKMKMERGTKKICWPVRELFVQKYEMKLAEKKMENILRGKSGS